MTYVPLPSDLLGFLQGRVVLINTNATCCPHTQAGTSSININHLDILMALYRLLVLSEAYPIESIQTLSQYEAHAKELAAALSEEFKEPPHPLTIPQSQGSKFPLVILNMVKTGLCRGYPENKNIINVGISWGHRATLHPS